MADVRYPRDWAALLFVDPYNVECTSRFATELGYHVTLVTDATAAFTEARNQIEPLDAASAVSLGVPHEQIRSSAPRISGGKLELMDLPALPVA